MKFMKLLETEIGCLSVICDVLFGKSKSNAFVVIRVEVSIKNISNKKTISVIEDILKLGLILFLLFNAIIYCDVVSLEIQ